MKNLQGISAAKSLYRLHIAVFAIICLGMILCGRTDAARSFGMGSTVWLLPQMMFSSIVFANQSPRQIKQSIKKIYGAQVLKFMLTIVLFGACFTSQTINPLGVFAGYMLSSLLIFFIPLYNKARTKSFTEIS